MWSRSLAFLANRNTKPERQSAGVLEVAVSTLRGSGEPRRVESLFQKRPIERPVLDKGIWTTRREAYMISLMTHALQFFVRGSSLRWLRYAAGASLFSNLAHILGHSCSRLWFDLISLFSLLEWRRGPLLLGGLNKWSNP